MFEPRKKTVLAVDSPIDASWLCHPGHEAQKTPWATALTSASASAGSKQKSHTSQTAGAEAAGDRDQFQSCLAQLLKMKVSQLHEVSPLSLSKRNGKKSIFEKSGCLIWLFYTAS